MNSYNLTQTNKHVDIVNGLWLEIPPCHSTAQYWYCPTPNQDFYSVLGKEDTVLPDNSIFPSAENIKQNTKFNLESENKMHSVP